jgi:hypothetical protein
VPSLEGQDKLSITNPFYTGPNRDVSLKTILQNSYLRWVSICSGLLAVAMAAGRAVRRGGFGRASLSAMLGGVCVASIGLYLMPEGAGGMRVILLLVWCALTHISMAATEAFLAFWVVGRARLYPMKALRGAVVAALAAHAGGLIAYLVLFFLGMMRVALEGSLLVGLIVLFPFAISGGFLASLGTIYGDLGKNQTRPSEEDHVPG